MKKLSLLVFSSLLFLLGLTSCNNDEETSNWLIPREDVFDGGPGKDGIPSIDDPQFTTASEVTFLNDNDLVLGIKVGNEVRAYPHPVLDWHEIVNDEVNNFPVAITYCPLTGTGIGWEREINNSVTTFGVSGLLYNTNLIPYDRKTDSRWSQMELRAVAGELAGQPVTTYPLVETTWATWKTLYPDSEVLNTNTGFARNYNQYPYGDYRTNNNLILFPINNQDDRFPAKDRGLGIVENLQAKFYHLGLFDTETAGTEVVVYQDNFKGKDIVIAGSKEENFIVAYQRKLPDGALLEFQPNSNKAQTDILMLDQEGNSWNIFGEAVSGPRQGERLPGLDAYIGFWFSWPAFFDPVEVFQP